MAIQQTAGRVAGTQRVAERERIAWPSTIPANTVIGIFDGVIDAVQAAALLRAHGRQVWVVTGEPGAEAVRNAWESRSWADRIAGALGDESQLIEDLIEAAGEGQTIVAANGGPAIEGFANAAAVYRVGRWTFGRVR